MNIAAITKIQLETMANDVEIQKELTMINHEFEGWHGKLLRF